MAVREIAARISMTAPARVAAPVKARYMPEPRSNKKIPPKIRTVLNSAPAFWLTPRSLRAFLSQLNHGEIEIAANMPGNMKKGVMMPSSPVIRIHIIFFADSI